MASRNAASRFGLIARWPAGIAVVSWRYMWRTTPVHRSDEPATAADLPEGWDSTDTSDDRQPLGAGSGPLLHRTYLVRIAGSDLPPEALMARITADVNRNVPEVAVFRKTRGAASGLRRRDEFVVRMPGPWDGPVRVIRRDATSFRLATLAGHLEAGQIEFRTGRDGDLLCFVIESWARAGDRLSDLLYNRLRLAKEIQFNMWTHFCLRVARLADGKPQGGVTVRTHRLDWPPAAPAPGPAKPESADQPVEQVR